MSKRVYSDEEKAAALAALDANGGNVNGTAQVLDIPEATLRAWAEGRNQHPSVAEMHERKKGELAEKFETVAHMLLDVTTDDAEGMRKTNVRDRMIAAGVAVDKKLLLTGKPTAIVERRDPAWLWRETVRKAVERAKSAGVELTEAEAIRQLVEWKPEARQYLLAPAPAALQSEGVM